MQLKEVSPSGTNMHIHVHMLLATEVILYGQSEILPNFKLGLNMLLIHTSVYCNSVLCVG